MFIGLSTLITDASPDPSELARELEERGFESIWVAEHTHQPTEISAGPDVPWTVDPSMAEAYDPFLVLTAAAHATQSLRLATGVCLLVERDPIITAKEMATLDRLSHGRALFGVGAGWIREELASHGTEYRTRYQVLDERLRAIREIWTKDVASFEGRFVNFAPMRSYPKPVQRPYPPIFLGVRGPRGLQLVENLELDWLPWSESLDEDLSEIATTMNRLREARGSSERPLEVSLSTSTVPSLAAIDKAVAIGISRVVIDSGCTREELLQTMDAIGPLLDRFADPL